MPPRASYAYYLSWRFVRFLLQGAIPVADYDARLQEDCQVAALEGDGGDCRHDRNRNAVFFAAITSVPFGRLAGVLARREMARSPAQDAANKFAG
jgi:hypothetical protein